MPFDEALGTYALRPNCMLVLVHFSTRLCRFHMRPEWAFGDVSAGSDHGSFCRLLRAWAQRQERRYASEAPSQRA
jgi:hypothetical protein